MLRNKSFGLVIGALVFAVGFAAGHLTAPAGVAQAQTGHGDHVFELRTYTSAPGKLGDLEARFRDHTVALFEKHGMTNVGYWVPTDEPLSENTLIYVLEHESREAAQASWDAFLEDPDWKEARAASVRDGALVEGLEAVFMQATDYSPLK